MFLWFLVGLFHPSLLVGLLVLGDAAPYAVVLLEQYVPVIAAAIVTVVLVRTGASQKLTEYRRETMEMIRTRSELLEKQLAEAHGEILELQKEVKRRDRRIENLEDEMAEMRQQSRAPRPRTQPAPPHAVPAPPPDSSSPSGTPDSLEEVP